MTPEQLAEIQRLRDRQVNPKQIARKLSLRPAEVKAAIQDIAAAQSAKGELAPVERCSVNSGMVDALFNPTQTKDSETLGLGNVMVVRNERGRLVASIFLVDYYCLGVKNAMIKKFNNINQLNNIQDTVFAQFDEAVVEVSLAQAKAIVFGAEDYARSLGLAPHKDYEKAKQQLGERPETLPELTFGRNGKPFYFQGPYDNSEKIIATLNKSVGEGNYDWTMAML